MSLRKAQARLIVDEETTGDVRAVTVFGHTLTENFATIEVSDEEYAKLDGNPHIELKGDKPSRSTAAETPPAAA